MGGFNLRGRGSQLLGIGQDVRYKVQGLGGAFGASVIAADGVQRIKQVVCSSVRWPKDTSEHFTRTAVGKRGACYRT